MITPTLTQAKKLYPLLEQQDKTLEEVAQEVLAKAFELYEERAKYAVVVQAHTIAGEHLKPGQGGTRSGVLQLYPTKKQAGDAAHGVCIRTVQNDAATVWVVPMLNQKPSEFWSENTVLAKGAEEDHTDEKVRRVIDSSSYTPICSEHFVTAENALQICTEPYRHDGPHRGYLPSLPDNELRSPRRLTGLPIDTDNEEEEL